MKAEATPQSMREPLLKMGEVGTLREDSLQQNVDGSMALEGAKKNVQVGISFQLVGQHPDNAFQRGRAEEISRLSKDASNKTTEAQASHCWNSLVFKH